MLELFVIAGTLVNLSISTIGTQRYLSIVATKEFAFRISCLCAIVTGATIGIFGLWLEWWLFLAICTAMGFFGVIKQYRTIMQMAKEHKYQQWKQAHEAWMRAKPYKNTRTPETFVPDAKLLP